MNSTENSSGILKEELKIEAIKRRRENKRNKTEEEDFLR
jgi:hypothetical protein